jgi:hypothetical protein
MKCPCENCICVPICRNILYKKLVEKCDILDRYIESNSRRNKGGKGMRLVKVSALREVEKALNWDWFQ